MCCGDTTRTIWGEVRFNGCVRAVYYVRWSPEHLDEHAVWLLYIEPWDKAPPTEWVGVALYCRSHGRWPAFMVVDGQHTPWGKSGAGLGRLLLRSDVVGQQVARDAYAIVNQVLAQDSRVGDLMRAMIAAEPPRWRRWLADRWGIGRRVHRCEQRPAAAASSDSGSS